MAIACCFLWALRAIKQNKQYNPGQKSAQTVQNQQSQMTEKEAARMQNKALTEVARATSTPWIREALHDPEFRKATILFGAQKSEPDYVDIYKILEIDDATITKLGELLAERSHIAYEIGMDVLSNPDATGISMENLTKIALADHEKIIMSLLGSEKYSMLIEYENSLGQRNKIKLVREELEFSGEPLTLEQETALLPILGRFSESNSLGNMHKNIAAPPRSYTASLVAGELEILTEVLSTQQIEALTKLKTRQERWKSLNYSWQAIGKRMRSSK
jgi:hypothetical protein